MKVKITKVPNKRHGGTNGSATQMHSGQQTPPTDAMADPRTGKFHGGNTPEIQINRTLKPTSRENATLEAEKGETVITNLQQDGIPEFYKIGGKPHSRGGTPLNLPKSSFIFSKDKKLKIKDPDVLNMFGKTGKAAKKAYTPADLSKKYDINFYREILANPFSDKLQRETAEMMIANYNLKLGALALTQESMKGFDAGIPEVAQPYMEAVGISPDDLILSEPPAQEQLQQFQGGGAYMGAPSSKRVRIKSLPRFDNGGPGDKKAPKVSSKPTAKQNIPKGAVQWDPKADGYDPSKVKEGHYIMKDGRWRKVTGYKKAEYQGDFKDEKLGDWSDDYGMLVETFEKDDALMDAMYTKYMATLNKTQPGRNLTQAQIDAAKQLSPEEVWENFKYKQKSNFAVQNQLGDLSEADKKDLWDSNPKLAAEAADKAGFPALDTEHIAAFQAAYIGMNELSNDPEFKDKLKNFGMIQTGRGDEQVSGTGEGTISQVDGWDGNTTSGQVMVPIASEMMTEDVADIKADPEVVTPEVKHLAETKAQERTPFWTEDNMNVARDFGNLMSVKKYRPWQATPAFETADPAFVDFRGAANRLAANTAGLAKGASNFGPGTYGTLASNVQGQMANNILKLQEQEMAKNVDTANRFELTNTAAINAYNQQKAAQDTKLWDKNAIMNQQFDNSKMALRNNLANSMRDRWTNRGKTQNLNLMSDQFSIDPLTGFKTFTGDNRDIDPAQQGTALTDLATTIKNENAGMTYDEALKWAKANKGIQTPQLPVGVNYPGAAPTT